MVLWYQLSRKEKAAPRGNILGATELQGAVNFSYKDLKSATKNFSEDYKLGEGGFGDVYKGVLKNGNIVAVKKLAIGSTSRAKADFEVEVKLISNVHHRNILRLLGCSNKGPDLLLVYDYMANGSLDKYLYAPEYAIHGQLSEKVDTYSFGVVVLEIVSGRRCNEMVVEPFTDYLLEQAWKLYEDGMHLKLVDESLDLDEYTEEEVKKVIEIALMCTQSPVSSRPTMSEVIFLLTSEGSMELRRPPGRPTFIDNDKRVRGDTSTTTTAATINSNATASFTEVTGR
ncbi:hypothetical protein U1Q18_049061 [Sarracenia purpurea var. burkii]